MESLSSRGSWVGVVLKRYLDVRQLTDIRWA
ncbi:MAG: hypothetical protein JWM95_164 [Gemmatimonadetes bacterium]|nr:hypothetical protein [Gemmatimonadota bacterium]